MGNTLRILKDFCRLDFADRNWKKAAALLSRDIIWFGTSDQEDVRGWDGACAYLADEIRKLPTPYRLTYRDEQSLSTGERSGVAFLRLGMENCGADVQVRITASSREEDGAEKLCSMHFSVADKTQMDGEYFPVRQHELTLAREKESLVLSTMAGGMMGGYHEPGFPFYFINDRMLEYLGYESEAEFVAEIRGSITNVMHPDDRAMVDASVDKQLAASGEYAVDYRMRKKDGSYIWVHDIGKLTQDAAGKSVIVSVCYDITQEHTKQTQLDNIINAIPGGVVIYKICDRFETVYFSDGVAELSGYSVEEYGTVIHGDGADLIHPDDREMAKREVRKACAQHTKADFVFRRLHRDGQTVWVHVQASVIGESGGYPLMQCVFHNISGLKEQELLNRHLLNSMSGGAVIYEIMDEGYRVLQYSEGVPELTGYTEAEFAAVANDASGLVYPEDVARVNDAIERLRQIPEAIQLSHRLRTKNGQSVGVHMNARVIGSKDGHPLVCAVFMKMSEESNLYQFIAQKSSDGIYVIRRDDHMLLYANAQARRTFALGEGACSALGTCHQALRKSGTPCEECPVFAPGAEGETQEIYVGRLDRYFSCVSYPVDWEGVPAYVVYISDVTQRKKASREVENIYNNIPGAVFRCRFDADWSVLSANDGLFRFLGYTRREFADMGNRMSAVIYPEDLAVMTPKISTQLEAGLSTVENENRLICKDGTVKWIAIKAQLLTDESGERYFYCVFVDITRQKENEQRRIAVEKNLSVAVAHMGMYYWEIIDFKKRRIHSGEQVQRRFHMPEYCDDYPDGFLQHGYVAPEDCQAYRSGVERICSGEPYVQFDARVRTQEDDFVWMRFRMTRIAGVGAESDRAVCTAEEIAEYKTLEQRFNLVMEQNDISTWLYDARRDVLQFNQQGYLSSKFLRTKQEMRPRELVDVGYIWQEDADAFVEMHERITAGEALVHARYRVRDAETGQLRYRACTYTLLPDRSGKPTYALGSSLDVTEQVEVRSKYENAVRNRYRTLGDHVLLAGHANITTGEILELEDRTGLDLQARFGLRWSEFDAGFGALICNAEQRKAYDEALSDERLETDFRLGVTRHSVEFSLCLDEKTRDMRWVGLSIDLVENPDSRDLLGFLTLTDLSDVKRQEQVLESVTQHSYDYIAYANLNADTLIILRSKGRAQKGTQYEYNQTYSLTCAARETADLYVAAEEREDYCAKMSAQGLKKALEDNESCEYVFHMTEADGEHTKRVRVAVLDRAAGTAVMTRSDVTELVCRQEQQRKRLAETLEIAESANRHKTEFLSSMSHDIRTPMNAIMGMCELALEDEGDTSQVHDSLSTIRSSSQLLLTLINNILDMSRIESGRMVLNDAPFSLSEQVNKTAESYRFLARQKHQNFRLSLNVIHDSCRGDAAHIHSAIDNVLSNAIKYTPEGGTVFYRVTELPSGKPDIGQYRFEIADTGVGMTPEKQLRIFEPFYRGESRETANVEGSGLGLSITKEIVELKGGTISVKSKPGEGSIFLIELPLHFSGGSGEDREAQESKPTSAYDLSGIHILLCEDHPINQKVVTRMLERAHGRVTVARDGQEGLERFERSQPGTYQLILMDIRMPRMDGYEATAAIRSCGHAQAKTIPIIALSANAFSEDIQKSVQCGMNAHLAKPVVPNQLCQTVLTYCSAERPAETAAGKVLFVDDTEINIAILTLALQDEYRVFVARSGAEALATLEQNPDMSAVITDIVMPNMDGIALVKAIRAQSCYDHVAVIANTQYGDAEQENTLRLLGADDFIYKPTDPKTVAQHVKEALRRRGH